MKRIFTYIFSAAAALAAALSCDQVRVDEVVPQAPVVTSFAPQSGPAGTVVVVTGEHLYNVTSASIGGVAVEIVEKVSATRLSIKVNQKVTSGAVTLVNLAGSGSSEASFTATFAVPSLTAGLLTASAGMGETILLSGERLNAVRSVLFQAGDNAPHTATILSQSDEELVVKVPYVEDASARVLLSYFDGSAEVMTPVAEAPVLEVVRNVPTFDAYTFERTAVGRSITLTGKNLAHVEKVMVGEFEAFFKASSESLSFTIPAGDFVDGETSVTLKAVWFEGHEEKVLAEEFKVFVPFVLFWEGIVVPCQGRTATSSYTSFFSPADGKAYPNADWATKLDPVAAVKKNDIWLSANVHQNLTAEEYDSVLPYFFFSAVSDGPIQLNSPANSNGQIKNFFVSADGTPANDFRVPGSNANLPGTPILTFRYLRSTVPAESALRDQVLAGTIEKIDETTFPIDLTAVTAVGTAEVVGTIAGVAAPTSGSVNTKTWCPNYTPDVTPATLSDNRGCKPDPAAVILVCYYDANGYDSAHPAEHIRRIGLIEITNVDWLGYISGSTKNYGASEITFNCYWQKYDYDYNKVKL